MHDLPLEINAGLRLYADGVSLVLEYHDREEAIQTFEGNLERLTPWAKTWHMKFNHDKSEILTFSRKRNKEKDVELMMSNLVMTQAYSQKHLWVSLQYDGEWGAHMEDISRRAKRRVDILTV